MVKVMNMKDLMTYSFSPSISLKAVPVHAHHHLQLPFSGRHPRAVHRLQPSQTHPLLCHQALSTTAADVSPVAVNLLYVHNCGVIF